MHYGIHTIISSLCRGIYLSEAMLGFDITESHGSPQTFKDALNTHYASVQ